jgi:flagellin
MRDITLSVSVRDSLLSLNRTDKLVGQTGSRLSTGLKVSSAIDDAVAFFQSKALSDRAQDFSERKMNIDQAISALTAANDGIEAVDSIVRQLKGLAQILPTAPESRLAELTGQYNDLRNQIDELVADTSYNGINLINGTGSCLTSAPMEQTSGIA